MLTKEQKELSELFVAGAVLYLAIPFLVYQMIYGERGIEFPFYIGEIACIAACLIWLFVGTYCMFEFSQRLLELIRQ